MYNIGKLCCMNTVYYNFVIKKIPKNSRVINIFFLDDNMVMSKAFVHATNSENGRKDNQEILHILGL